MSQSNNLRQKAIGVLYLVVLCLFFLYYSLDFSDSIYLTHRRMDRDFHWMSTAADVHITDLTKHAFRKDSAAAAERMALAVPVDAVYAGTIRLIDSLEASLIGASGLNLSGYPVKGKSHFPVQQLMIKQQKADTLWGQLDGFYALLGRKDSTVTDSIVNYKGKKVPPARFYFDHMPMNMALAHLSSLKMTMLQERIDFYDRLFKDDSKKEELASVVQPLHDTAVARGGKSSSDTAVAKAPEERIDTTVGQVGQTVTIRLPRVNSGQKEFIVRVSSSERDLDRTRTASQQYSFTPRQPGLYRFTVTAPDGHKVRQVDVIVAQPLITHPQYSTLFTGIDNQLEVKDLLPGKDPARLRYKVEGPGQVIVRAKSIYFRTDKKGKVAIMAYDDAAGSSAPLCVQEFVVRDLSMPTAYIRGTSGSADITAGDLHVKTALAARSEELLVPEEVYVSDFDFIFIPNAGKPFSFYYHNTGASFNDKVRDALSQVRPGNIILFTNIHTKSSLGAERAASSFMVNVK